jgi:hypothetical protein
MLVEPDFQRSIIGALLDFSAEYEQDNDILRFRSSIRYLHGALTGLEDLQREPLVFAADESVSTAHPGFITQDEVDRVLCGGNVEHGKFRIYSHFMQGHTPKEKADFLKNEYGWGGTSRTGFSENHDTKGIVYSRENNHMPYDKVTLPWPKVAKRIDELIEAGTYMSQRELNYILEYEKGELARAVYSFYYNQPEDVPRPYPYATYNNDAVNIIRPQLDQPERVTWIVTQMQSILDNTADFDRHYQSIQKAFADLIAYKNGTFSLFTPVKPTEQTPAQPAIRKPPTVPAPSAVLDDGTVEYDLQLGATAYLGISMPYRALQARPPEDWR